MTIEISAAILIPPGACTDELPDPVSTKLYDIEGVRERNRQRGLFAGLAAKTYGTRTGTGSSEDIETTLSDLLGDLRHLCDGLGIDFASLDERGFRHYQDEIGGEG